MWHTYSDVLSGTYFNSRSQWAPPDLNYELQMGTAGPQLRAPDLSGHCRTSVTSSRSQWALPDLNRELQISVALPDSQTPERMSDRTSAVEVRQCRLRSGVRCWGKEGRKEGRQEGREGKGREGKGREGKGREGKGREGTGREGKGREGGREEGGSNSDKIQRPSPGKWGKKMKRCVKPLQ